jgi:uncharacterized membrane protein YphA (DoxX/SURF4 family)
MNILTTILVIFLAFASLMSAAGKLRKMPQVMESMAHVGVKPDQIRILAYLEIAGGLGLVVGFAVPALGVAAAVGLALYFVGAVVAHLRIGDKIAVFGPALLLAVIAIATTYLSATSI